MSYKLFKKNNGFTRSEANVALSLAVIAISGLAWMFFNLKNAGRQIEVRHEVMSTLHDMHEQLLSQQSCRQAFLLEDQFPFDFKRASQKHHINSGQIEIGSPVKLRLPTGERLVRGQTLAASPIRTHVLSLIESQKVGVNSNGSTVHQTTLFTSLAGSDSGFEIPYPPRKVGSFFIAVDQQQKIVDCFNTNPNDRGSLAAFSDFLWKDKSCPEGKYVSGFSRTGELICRSIQKTNSPLLPRIPATKPTASMTQFENN